MPHRAPRSERNRRLPIFQKLLQLRAHRRDIRLIVKRKARQNRLARPIPGGGQTIPETIQSPSPANEPSVKYSFHLWQTMRLAKRIYRSSCQVRDSPADPRPVHQPIPPRWHPRRQRKGRRPWRIDRRCARSPAINGPSPHDPQLFLATRPPRSSVDKQSPSVPARNGWPDRLVIPLPATPPTPSAIT